MSYEQREEQRQKREEEAKMARLVSIFINRLMNTLFKLGLYEEFKEEGIEIADLKGEIRRIFDDKEDMISTGVEEEAIESRVEYMCKCIFQKIVNGYVRSILMEDKILFIEKIRLDDSDLDAWQDLFFEEYFAGQITREQAVAMATGEKMSRIQECWNDPDFKWARKLVEEKYGGKV